MFCRTWKKTFLQQKNRGRESVLEIRNQKLCIDDTVIGDEEKLLTIFDKAVKYDELKASFEKRGDA